jgi:hypothetical protein
MFPRAWTLLPHALDRKAANVNLNQPTSGQVKNFLNKAAQPSG